MSSEKMLSKIKEIPKHQVVLLNGSERVFYVKTVKNGYAYPNLSFTGNNQILKLIVWKLTEKQLEKLDADLIVQDLYHRISLPVFNIKRELLLAQTYIPNISHIGFGFTSLTRLS
jgi:hypothetical protein